VLKTLPINRFYRRLIIFRIRLSVEAVEAFYLFLD
jgi:hypothetical protein